MGTTEATDLDQLAVNTIRTLSMDAVQKANSGHPGTPMGLAPLGYVLYSQVMRHNPANPAWANRDRFVLSAGHACMLQYSCLHLSRLRRLARRHQAVPPVGQPLPGPPRVRRHGGDRDLDRPARPGRRQRASASRWRRRTRRRRSTAPAARSSTTTPS